VSTPIPSSPEDPRKDTSLPGREEEVIVNTEVQRQATNIEQTSNDISSATDANIEKVLIKPEVEKDQGDKTFKEGLGDNSNTEEYPLK
jgi:hypothetical protein